MDRMVPGSAAAAVSDVLGRAHYLSRHAIRVGRGTFRPSILTELDRRSFLPARYSFLLFESGLVVLRPAHSIVLRVPCVVPDASEDGSGRVPRHNRTRDFDFPLPRAVRTPRRRRLRARSVLRMQAF